MQILRELAAKPWRLIALPRTAGGPIWLSWSSSDRERQESRTYHTAPRRFGLKPAAALDWSTILGHRYRFRSGDADTSLLKSAWYDYGTQKSSCTAEPTTRLQRVASWRTAMPSKRPYW